MSASRHYLSLSLHSDYICMIEAENNRVRAIGAKEIVQPFDFAAYQDNDSFLEDQKVHIKDLFQRIGADSREIGVAIGGERVIIKQLPVALGLDDETINAHLTWEAEKMVVGQLDEFIHEFEKLPFQTPEGSAPSAITRSLAGR